MDLYKRTPIKAYILEPGKDTKVLEYEDSWALFEEHHEYDWGVTKKECSHYLNRDGYFSTLLEDKKYTEGTYIFLPKADYWGAQLTLKELEEAVINKVESQLALVNDHPIRGIKDRLIGLIREINREDKLNELGI